MMYLPNDNDPNVIYVFEPEVEHPSTRTGTTT